MTNKIVNEIEVYIRDAENVKYDGSARAVTSVNDTGMFDILPYHANLICIVKNYVKLYDKTGQIKEFKVDSGVLRASNNKVEVYLGV